MEAKILSNEFVLTEGDILICNVDGREEKFIVHVKTIDNSVHLRNVSRSNAPLNVYIGKVLKLAVNNLDNDQ